MFSNVKLDVDEYGRISNAVKQQQLQNDLRQSIEYVNAFCKRNYQDVWFVELIIADEIEYKPGF